MVMLRLLAPLSPPAGAQNSDRGPHPTAESPQQSAAPGTVPVSLIVSVEAKTGTEVPFCAMLILQSVCPP